MVTLEATKQPAPARAATKRRKPAAKKPAETPTAS
jgi:hypothetical protein